MSSDGKEVSGDDHFGIVDDTRNGLQRGYDKARSQVPETYGSGDSIGPAGGCHNERESVSRARAKPSPEFLADEERAALLLDGEEVLTSSISVWEGVLPDPVSFSQYPEYVNARWSLGTMRA